MADVKVSEIIRTLQGEGTRAGLPCILVRLSGCNLRCSWCDTRWAMEEGRPMTVDEVLAEVRSLRCPRVELTGGEPLLQPAAQELLRRLCDEGFETLLETNGSIDISPVDLRVVRIVDVECPSSGQAQAMRWENLPLLTPRDEVKFVLADRADYDYATRVIGEHRLAGRCPLLMSPVMGEGGLDPADLAGWILQSGLDVRLSLQLHRILWPHADRGV